jgi:hypothetical protein
VISSLNVNDVPGPTAFAGYGASRLDQAAEPEVFVGVRPGSHRFAFSYSPPHLDWRSQPSSDTPHSVFS